MKISDLKIMVSAAGFYLGRSYEEDDLPGVEFPYSRESEYFGTAYEANQALAEATYDW